MVAASSQLDHIEATTAQLLDQGVAAPRYQQIVMNAQADAAREVRLSLDDGADENFAIPPLFSPQRSELLNRAYRLEAIGRASASDTPLETLASMAPRGSAGRWSNVPEIAGVRPWTTQDLAQLRVQVIGGGDADIAAAYESGGIDAATAELRAQVEAGTPEDAAALIARSRALVSEAGNRLDGLSSFAEGGTSRQQPARDEFDAIVGDLSALYDAASGAGDGGAEAVHGLLRTTIASHIGSNVRAYDEGLARAAIQQGHAGLAIDVVGELVATGRTRQADAIVNRADEEFALLVGNANDAQADFDSRVLEAQVYTDKAGPLADEQGIKTTLDAFWAEEDNVNSKRTAEAQSLAALQGAAALTDLAGAGGTTLDHVDDALGQVDAFAGDVRTLRMIASHDAAQAYVAVRQFQSAGGNSGLFSPAQLHRAIGRADDPDQVRDAWFAVMQNVAVAQSASFKAAGEHGAAEAAISSLGRYDDVFASGDESYDQVIEGLRMAARADDPTRAQRAVEFLSGVIGPSVDVLGTETPISGRFSSSSAAVLAYVGAGNSGKKAIDDPSLQNLASLGVDSAEALLAFDVAISHFADGGTTAAQLAGALRWVDGAGAVLNTIDLFANPSDNDVINGLKATSTIGSWMVLSSSAAVAGLGAGITLAAAIAIYQYGRVAESNRYETGDATRFLMGAAGLNETAAYHLRNDDENGHNHNEVVYRAVAQALGIEADFSSESKQEVVDFLNSLDGSQLDKLADRAAHIDYESVTPGTGGDVVDGNGQVYPERHETDEFYDRVRREYAFPRSVNGLALWIENTLLVS